MTGASSDNDDATPQAEDSLLAALARRELSAEAVSKPDSAEETTRIIQDRIVAGWEHYLSCDRYLYFRCLNNPSGHEEEEEPPRLTCKGCSGFSAENEETGICPVDGVYRQADLPCDFGFGHPDEWRRAKQQ